MTNRGDHARDGGTSAGKERPQHDSVTAHTGRGQAVELARLDRSGPVQRFLLDSKDNVLDAWSLFRRLGLRKAPLQNKLPYWESAQQDEKATHVFLQAHMTSALQAKRSGFQSDTAARPKPRFRTQAPGLGTLVAANLLLMWVCLNGQF